MPDGSTRLPIDELEQAAKAIDYPQAARSFLELKRALRSRPINLIDHPVMGAWQIVLAKESHLLHHARSMGLSERSATSYFLKARGPGIPRSPRWQAALAQAQRRRAP